MTKLQQAALYGGALLALVVLAKGLLVATNESGLPWWFFAPQWWLVVIAVGISWGYYKNRPSPHAWLLTAVFPVAVLLVSFWTSLAVSTPVETWQQAVDNWYLEVNNVRAGDLGLMYLYVLIVGFLIFKPARKEDFLLKGLFVIGMTGETYMLAEHALCNFVWPVAGSDIIAAKIIGADGINACARVDLPWLIWVPIVVQMAPMVWLLWMLERARERAPRV